MTPMDGRCGHRRQAVEADHRSISLYALVMDLGFRACSTAMR